MMTFLFIFLPILVAALCVAGYDFFQIDQSRLAPPDEVEEMTNQIKEEKAETIRKALRRQ